MRESPWRKKERDNDSLSSFFNFISVKEFIFSMILIFENSQKILKISRKMLIHCRSKKYILDE